MFFTRRKERKLHIRLNMVEELMRNIESSLNGHLGSLEQQIQNPSPAFEPGRLAATHPLDETVDKDRAHGDPVEFPNGESPTES